MQTRNVLRQLLALIVGLPMLMPPGMCVCQFMPCNNASNGYVRTSYVSTGDPDKCCKCSSRSDRAGLVAPIGGTVAKSSPGQLPHEHAPSCPAALGATPNKISPAPFVMPPSLDLAVSYFWVEIQTISSRGQQDEALVQGSPPPLFLAHCSFLL